MVGVFGGSSATMTDIHVTNSEGGVTGAVGGGSLALVYEASLTMVNVSAANTVSRAEPGGGFANIYKVLLMSNPNPNPNPNLKPNPDVPEPEPKPEPYTHTLYP